MTGDEDSSPVVRLDTQARLAWMRTGYKFFPYAARWSDQWWVLRSRKPRSASSRPASSSTAVKSTIRVRDAATWPITTR